MPPATSTSFTHRPEAQRLLERNLIIKLVPCALVCVILLDFHLAVFADETPITKDTQQKNNPTQLANDFPTLESAAAEIKRLNERINIIESPYEKEFAQARKQVSQMYAAKLTALTDEISVLRDASETVADFDVRREKQRIALNRQRSAELLRLTPSALAALETEPLRSSIAALENHDYVFGLESLETELEPYNTESQQYTVRVRSKTPAIQLSMKGVIPLSPTEAKLFQQQWQMGLVRPEATIRLVSDTPVLSFVNNADNTRMANWGGTFMTAMARQEKIERNYRPEMVTIPSGSFDMGSNEYMPIHRVTFIRTFAISKTEITQGQWRAVMGKDSIRLNSCGDACPVEKVSWDDAQNFIQKLNIKTGKQYRLPSEAEWEYACRAGGKHEFCGSDNVDDVAWYGRNSGSTIHPVATKQANAFGLHDMSGNVWEWVEDGYQNNYIGAPVDGTSWQGNNTIRAVRGGSRSGSSLGVRMSVRDGFEPSYRFIGIGFRLARTLP